MLMKMSFIIAGLLVIIVPTVYSAGLDEGSIYRLGVIIEDIKAVGDKTTIYIAPKNSKFEVLEANIDDVYIVQFVKVGKLRDEYYAEKNRVILGKAYRLPKKTPSILDISKVSKKSLTGLTAGPLVVPFKYRLDDESLSGSAEIGLYAGVTYDIMCTKSNWCFQLTPLVSAGISQVTVADGDETENKSGATIAAGFLITNWTNLNIGLIYGQDRIGDSSWEHEGEGWLSFMIGWKLD